MSWTIHGYRVSCLILFENSSSHSKPFFNSSVFVNTALILWAFNLKPDRSAPIDDLAFTESANTHPLPFKVIFEPRAAKSMEGVREMIEEYGLWMICPHIWGLHYFWFGFGLRLAIYALTSYLLRSPSLSILLFWTLASYRTSIFSSPSM